MPSTSPSTSHRSPEAFFAVCPRGIEAVLLAELQALGALAPEAVNGGVLFRGDLRLAYAANLHLRSASRILWRRGQGRYRTEDDLYRLVHDLPWERDFSATQSLRIDVTAHQSPLRSLQFATLRVKDAVVDRAREQSGERPDIDRQRPDVQIVVHLTDTQAQVYLDLSGESLFKRGWRTDKGEAPIKENLAAALLSLSGWQPEQTLLDPYCGSGTIAIEAACLATGLAPGMQRRFAFENLRSFDAYVWQSLKDEARRRVRLDIPVRIIGRDISTRVVEIARANALRAGLGDLLRSGQLQFEALDARQGTAPAPAGVIVSNPPYGEQSNPRSASVESLMRDYAATLKGGFAGWEVWMISSDRDLPRYLRLKESAKRVLFNGALECRFFHFTMVAGTNRRPRADSGPESDTAA